MKLRLATFNVSLYGKAAGEVTERLADGKDPQAISLSAIVQTVRPDVLLVNEIDYQPDAATVRLLAEKYFAVGRDGRDGIQYQWNYSAASNTGIDSMLDLDGNGRSGDPADAWGFGAYPGQYASAVLSRYPIDTESVRSFQKFRWADLPGALEPIFPDSNRKFYNIETWQRLRLSSKNHFDVPIRIGDKTLHVLGSHPTPPVFDGPEDRNGCRNHDEIMFWVHYIGGDETLTDDKGIRGGLTKQASFVVMGDLNSDPVIGDSRHEAIRKLLQHPRVCDPQPVRLPYAENHRKLRAQPHDFTKPIAATATADFGRTGQLRVDYVLPSCDLKITDAKVFWPGERDPASQWIKASDHRLVWVDVTMGE
ncbi:MAG TPA: endonuclease/exonuclease/phosphatase [Planctomycetaceae bacterium]|nr:endonuclease/exonuclease/phosphatase [Planctomycetaceae bacterium]